MTGIDTHAPPLGGSSAGPPRRILVVGAGGRHRTEAAIARGARALGHMARMLDAKGWTRLGRLAPALLIRMADRFAPDVVILTRYAARLDDATLARLVRGRQATTWYFDFAEQAHAEVVRLARASGSLYLTCPSLRETYSRAGVPDVRFLPQAVDPAEDHPAESVPARFRCDVSFVGSGQYPDRHSLLRGVASVADLQIRGPGWDAHQHDLPVRGGRVRGRRLARVIAGAAVSLGAAATCAQGEAPLCISNRMWKVLGCGGFFLGPWTPGIESLVREREHCALFRSEPDAIAQVRDWLGRPEERATIARVGRAHALAHHTYAHRLELLLRGESFPYTTV